MSQLHVRRIQAFLKNDFGDLIDLTDVQNNSSEQMENFFLTRSQAALALTYVADIDKQKAVEAIVDGFNDNGIDAIYFDEDIRIVYVIQSKWVSGGKKSPDLGSVEKFLTGFRDLITGRFDRFNEKLRAKTDVLEAALDSFDVEFQIVIAYTGADNLSFHADQRMKDLLEELNDPGDILSYRVLNLKELYNAISGGLENADISIDVTLHEWGQIREPFQAFYGQVSTEEIASWYHEYNSRLLARNLRRFKGDTEVNSAMKLTLTSEPGNFWYFNNGITVLCNRINKKPIGGASRDTGQFHCEGISVVNGAQTVGSIAASVTQGFRKAKDAKVLVRFISLENCPPEFAIEVTTATNRQNQIELRDFVSLDPTHERLRTEMKLDLDTNYVFRSGERDPAPNYGCNIEEATIALACSYPDTKLSSDAKRNISVLWADTNKRPYITLFNEQLTALRLWRTVLISREIEEVLIKLQKEESGTPWRILVHGNRFLLHCVFQQLPLDRFDELDFPIDPILDRVQENALQTVSDTVSAVQTHFQNEYLNTFFKSASKCKKLKHHLPIPAVSFRAPFFATDSKNIQGKLIDISD